MNVGDREDRPQGRGWSVRVSLKVELLWERWGRVLGKTLELSMDGSRWGDGD